MRRGWCEPSCTRCMEVCPTGALQVVAPKAKQAIGAPAELRIGTAFVDRGRCLPWAMDTPCIVCEEMCPTSPKASGSRRGREAARWDGRRAAEAVGRSRAVHRVRTVREPLPDRSSRRRSGFHPWARAATRRTGCCRSGRTLFGRVPRRLRQGHTASARPSHLDDRAPEVEAVELGGLPRRRPLAAPARPTRPAPKSSSSAGSGTAGGGSGGPRLAGATRSLRWCRSARRAPDRRRSCRRMARWNTWRFSTAFAGPPAACSPVAGSWLAYAFGSRVSGRAGPDSDLDVGYYLANREGGSTLGIRRRDDAGGPHRGRGRPSHRSPRPRRSPLDLRGRVLEDGVRIYSGNPVQRVALERTLLSRYRDYKREYHLMHEARLRRVATRGV